MMNGMENPRMEKMETEGALEIGRYPEWNELKDLDPKEKEEKLTALLERLEQEKNDARIAGNADQLESTGTKYRVFSQYLTKLKADRESPVTSFE